MDLDDDFIGEIFGENDQVKVVGWFGEKSGSNKKYTVECSVCKQDPELFGDGKFLITKGDLQMGRLPCGCSKACRWTKEQYQTRIIRECTKDDFQFLGWTGEYKGINSRILVSCPHHGVLKDKSLNDFLAGKRCIECRRDGVKTVLAIEDSEIISNFFSTGSFHPDTKFWRSDRLVQHPRYREGYRPYWNVVCGECGEQSETLYSVLKSGGSSCGCFIHKQKLAYINFVYDDELLIALKFGITSKKEWSQRTRAKQKIFSINKELCYLGVSGC